MKVLLIICGGVGDLIHFTGILQHIKIEYSHFKFDVLCKKNQSFVLKNNPNVEKILILEDYVPGDFSTNKNPSTSDEREEEIKEKFKNDYNTILNLSSKKDITEISEKIKGRFSVIDFLKIVMTKRGFPTKAPLKDMHPIFYFDYEDYIKAQELYKEIKYSVGSDLFVCLFEDESYSFPSKEQKQTNNVLKIWMKSGYANRLVGNKKRYISVGNASTNDFQTNHLSIKQLKIFFEKYGDYYFGMFSGITAGLTALPADFSKKRAITNISGLLYGESHYPYLENGFETRINNYSMDDCLNLLKAR